MTDGTMKTLRMLTSLLVCLAILFAFFTSVIQIFGFDLYGVLTGSMKPAIPPGSMIYLRDTDPDKLRIGDVITYSVSANVMATHRIVDIVSDENNPSFYRFQTKGDANPAVDAVLVEPKKIIGKVAFPIPYLGSVAHFIQKPPGIFVAIGISIVLIALVLLTDATTTEKLAMHRRKEPPDAAPTEKPMDEAIVQEFIPAPSPAVEVPTQSVLYRQVPPVAYNPAYGNHNQQGMTQAGYASVANYQRWQCSPQQPMQTQGYSPAYQQRVVYTRPMGAPTGRIPQSRPPIRSQQGVSATAPPLPQNTPYQRAAVAPTGEPMPQHMDISPNMSPQRRRRRAVDNPSYQ